jgi:hypothetical protein
MVKSNVRVRRLTLPPLFDAGAKEDTHQQEDEGEEDQIILEKERLSRVTEISLMAREGSRPGLHIHGVESPWGSKLWASGDDDASSVSSGDEDISSPALVSEALEAGLTMEQLRQAEEELSSPSSMSPKVRTHLKEGSIVKKVIDIWVDNRWNMGRPWSGSIMKNVIERRTQAINSTASRDHHHGSSMPQSSSIGPRLSPTMIVNVDRGLPKCGYPFLFNVVIDGLNLKELQMIGVTEPPQNEGFVSQDHIGGFSMKRECANTHK